MASLWPPKKNAQFTLCFTLYKNDGTVIANPGTYTKKVSIDGGAVADVTASVTEEDTTYGQLSLVLSADEMNGDWIWVYVKDDTAGCVPFTLTIYTVPATLGEMDTVIDSILDDTGTAGVVVASIANGAITAAAIAADAIGASELAADAVSEIADQVWDEATSGHTAAGSTGKALTDANNGTAPTAGAISDAVWDEATADHAGAGSTGAALAAVKTKTDNLPASPAAVGSAMTLDLTQAVPTANTAQTVGDALNAARAQGFGKWAFTGNTLTLYAPDDVTPVKTFTLDDPATPTVRA